MMVCKGEIWLVNLNPQKKSNEIGKTRPAVVIQNDLLNQSDYATVIVLPMTTVLIDDAEPLRFRVKKRASLEVDSDILVAHARAVDKERLLQKLGELSSMEMEQIRIMFNEVIF
ncbi:type II toxin-antitoxin system PemK/MazF family toxin [Sulfuricurvum sp.]|uniref:type II toxin-antitoxin system PemK/MazF family toxin n=1 Tax=Sulfuricurvum sp. TaxID=2025608 RepID=UPI003BB51F48